MLTTEITYISPTRCTEGRTLTQCREDAYLFLAIPSGKVQAERPEAKFEERTAEAIDQAWRLELSIDQPTSLGRSSVDVSDTTMGTVSSLTPAPSV